MLIDIHLYCSNRISNKDKSSMLFHHFCFMLGIYFSSSSYYYYSKLVLCEVTTLFLNICWAQEKNKIRKNFYMLNCVLLWLSFLLFRVYNLSCLLISLENDSNIHISIKIVYPIFLSLNYYWFYLLTKKGYRIFNN